MIKLKGISLSYAPERKILNDITFNFEHGGFYFLTGRSGAGKSSLLNILSLSKKPTAGLLEMFGQNVNRLGREQLPPLKRRIGKVFQDYRLLDHLTVEQNIGLPLKVAGCSRAEIKDKVAQIVGWIGLEEYVDEKPEILSGGQKQRVSIARAVIGKPDIILADEPTGNLDPALSLKFMYLFETLNKDGTTVIFATHDEGLVSKFSHHPVLNLADGKLSLRERTASPAPAEIEQTEESF